MLKRREFLAALASTAAGALIPKAFGKSRLESPLSNAPISTPRDNPNPALFFQTDAMVGRVTQQDAVVNLVTASNLTQGVLARVRWALDGDDLASSPLVSSTLLGADPAAGLELPLSGLAPNRRYAYRVEYASAQAPGQWSVLSPVGSFVSQKTAGRSFRFCIVSDAHWGQAGKVPPEGARWWMGINCMNEIARQGTYDFMLDLGDAPFPSVGAYEDALERYVLYREYMSAVTRRMPVYLGLGNHECEAGFYQRGTDDPNEQGPLWNHLRAEEYRQLWAIQARMNCIPNPRGDTYPEGGEGAPGYDSFEDWYGEPGPWNDGAPRTHLQNFYAWTWGDALFIVLDPFRCTKVGSILFPNSPTQYSLGAAQLQWLEDVLANSTAAWKFIFAHNQVGGGLINRGGDVIVDGGEGYAYARGSAVEALREGTEQALIHQLMLRYNAQYFIHGHDHGFSHSVLDGVHYVCCGRPTHLDPWWSRDGMTGSYGDLLQHGQNQPWMQNLFNVLGFAAFHVEPRRVTMQWIRTGYSYAVDPPSLKLAERDWLETWAGRDYPVNSPQSVTVTLPPKQVDAVRTLAGASISELFAPPTGADYQLPAGALSWLLAQANAVPLNQFPELTAVVDTVPEVVYEMTFEMG